MKNELFLKACRGETVDHTPVWFMRQAGRYMEEYRALRAKWTILELCRHPELATQVTLQPIQRFPLDAAILFADILLPLEPMGSSFEFAKGEGPVIHKPIRSAAQVDALRVIDPREGLGYVLDAVKMIRRELDGRVPLIGFAGAPFTLASYLIEGGRSSHFTATKSFMYREPEAWSLLMSKLSQVVGAFLGAQIEAGAQAVQLFDSWIGALSPADYVTYVQPHVRSIFQSLAAHDVPKIHFGTGTATLLEHQRDAGGTVIGIDWRVPLDQARARLGAHQPVQGNLDSSLLLGPRDVMLRQADRVMRENNGRKGHVFNLGHGIQPETPVASVEALVEFVHAWRPDTAT